MRQRRLKCRFAREFLRRYLKNSIILNYSKPSVSAYSIPWLQPLGASILPIWIPVRVSYSFLVTGPISVMPLSRQISLPWSTILLTGEITAAVPHRPASAKSFSSHNHGEQSIIELIFQYFTNGTLVLLVVLVALYHL